MKKTRQECVEFVTPTSTRQMIVLINQMIKMKSKFVDYGSLTTFAQDIAHSVTSTIPLLKNILISNEEIKMMNPKPNTIN